MLGFTDASALLVAIRGSGVEPRGDYVVILHDDTAEPTRDTAVPSLRVPQVPAVRALLRAAEAVGEPGRALCNTHEVLVPLQLFGVILPRTSGDSFVQTRRAEAAVSARCAWQFFHLHELGNFDFREDKLCDAHAGFHGEGFHPAVPKQDAGFTAVIGIECARRV